MGFIEAVYDPKEGTVLGRTASSWAKILLFYFLYYSFLAGLFYGSIAVYKVYRIPDITRPVTNNKPTTPALMTRMDQPGLAVHPFNNMDPAVKGANFRPEVELNQKKPQASKSTKNYIKVLKKFREQYFDKNNTELVLSDDEIVNSVKNGTPYFALSLNKIIGWKPINLSGKMPKKLKDNIKVSADFIKNATYFDCTAVDKNGKVLVNATYGIEYVGNNDGINKKAYFEQNGFPYEGKAKYSAETGTGNPYLKPFVLLRVTNSGDNKVLIYRCSVFVDNINSRSDEKDATGALTQNANDYNNDLDKLGVGSVTFAVTFKK